MFDIEENLKKLPDSPGVYLHKDSSGKVIYVGKAISLKKRVRQYFRSSSSQSPKVKAMVSHIAEFEYINCATEMEALILECNLIKKYRPEYNVLLRDDKTYPYIEVTINEKYPRVIRTRTVKRDGNRYFGPYSDAGAVNRAVDMFNTMFCLKRCGTTEFPINHRPCLNWHIDRCRGVCRDTVSREEYMESISKVLEFLGGKKKPLIDELKEKMYKASDELKFEEAAKYRDWISDIAVLSETQRVTLSGYGDMDIVLPLQDEVSSYIVLFPVREGKLSGRETFDLRNDMGRDRDFIVSEFIKQYYSKWADVPSEIIMEKIPEDKELLEDFLSEEGRKVRILVPQKGEKKALLKLAVNDRDKMAGSIRERAEAERERKRNLKNGIKEIISMSGYDIEPGDVGTEKRNQYRIECYDISNTNGFDTVGAMVVFEGTEKIRKDYRRFRIKTVSGPDDYGSMREMLSRRFKRAIKGDPAFSNLPDIILMDGGRGQVSCACEVLNELGLEIPVCGLAKDDSHRTRAAVFRDGREIPLRNQPLLYSYFGRIQEEVHRFAIEYHRKLRGKKAVGSVLDNIEGVGPVRRNALLSHFGSVEEIKKADTECLVAVDGITETVAENIVEFFKKA